MLTVLLLVVGIVTMFARPGGLPMWLGPAAASLAGVVSTAIRWSAAGDALDLLRDPLLFLVFAVPLAVLLDHLGVFAALAAAFGRGRHLVAWLWVLAALVTIVFNLDASVVLLTPLYIRIAQRNDLPAEALAFQPALLACLASNVLPVSNLTNLVVAEELGLGAGEFVRHLALATVVACTVGWFAYRHTFRSLPSAHVAPLADGHIDHRALRRGLPIIAFVLAGFTVGDAIGIAAWIVAAIAAAWTAWLVREVPWRAVPAEAIVIAASLAVLVAGASPHLRIDRFLDAPGRLGAVRALVFGVVGSNASNNLPAVLAGASSLHDRAQVWPLLVGVNIGPVLVISGSLSGLLWRDTARRLGVEVSARRFSAVGVRAGLPALLAAALVVVLLG